MPLVDRAKLVAFVTESNRIEGIDRLPTEAEIDASYDFLLIDRVMVKDLKQFVKVVSPNKCSLRDRPGPQVYVGNHIPPPGGAHIRRDLEDILNRVAEDHEDPYKVHCQYETLHPFRDGNGRSGRILWAWQMVNQHHLTLKLGFLHAFYYQTLEHSRR